MTDPFDDPDTCVQVEDDNPEALAGEELPGDPTGDDPDGTE